MNWISGLSPRIVVVLLVALLLSLAGTGALGWLLLNAHEQIGTLDAQYKAASAQLVENERTHKKDREAWSASLAARDEAVRAAQGRASHLARLLNDAGDRDEILQQCLDMRLPDSVRLP